MAAVQLDLAVCSALHLESSYTWRLFGKFTCSALGFHLECAWTSLGTTSKAFKGLQKPSKASKSLQSPHLEGLRRPSKALKVLRRLAKASLRRPSKAFEGSRMHLQSCRKVPRASRRPKARFFKTSEGPSRTRTLPSSALVSMGKSVREHCIEHCFCYHG